MTIQVNTQGSAGKLRNTLLAVAIKAILFSHTAAAQQQSSYTEKQPQQAKDVEVIQVSGIAETYRSAMAVKRGSTTIVDALSSADIGALPDLSVAETLERITGVSGDRFKGNASEISIRGLGPFLGFSTVNGRAISSGSGNRSVAFSQFPSELVNGVVVYKAQTAKLLEGGVSGLIDLQTIKPVDYGKTRFQAELKGNYNPYQAKFSDDNGVGHRESFSFTDNMDTQYGKFGYAIGYAGARTSSPEESYNTSSTLRNCNSDYQLDGGSNCNYSDSNAAAHGGNAVNGDYFFIPNSFYYRQMESKEKRDAVIVAVQWKPSDKVDINIDGQWSERNYWEDRHDLLWDDGRRRITNWSTNEEHALMSYTGESRISSYGEYRVRDEEYKGIGANIEWVVTPNLTLTADAAYSDTYRYQTRTYARYRGNRTYFDFNNSNGKKYPQVTSVYTDLDEPESSAIDWVSEVQDLHYFSADSQARSYRFDISDRINSYKLDADYVFDRGFFTKFSTGLASSTHKHLNYAEDSETLSTASADRAQMLQNTIDNCAMAFPQSDYGDDANSPIASWATFNTQCAYDTLTNGTVLSPDPKAPSSSDVDLIEDVTSIYAMASFYTQLGSIPVDGNIGIRQVETKVTSSGVRSSYSVEYDDNGFVIFHNNDDVLEFNTYKNTYRNLLPSVNLTFELQDDLMLRLAGYSAISRPDMWFFGAARSIGQVNADEEFTTVEDALKNNVSALGNPYLEALESDNLDASLSYYYDDDTMLSAAVYYKRFNAAFEEQSSFEDVVVDGQTYNVEVNGLVTIKDDSSSIKGLELTVLHSFKWLPEPFNGMGIAMNYNYADSSFETPEAGSNITDDVLATIAPANIAGLSKHTFNTQLYWEDETYSARLSYKFRSEYYKPFGPNLAQTNRFVDDTGSYDLSLGYKINKHLKAKLQILNLTNEPYVEQRVAHEAYNRIEYSGARYFLGLKYQF
ncbi:TonB-dependent receptor [Neptunicella marina]|uniref:TonB-dependent receptor n=1 Tax=Neptunicella marina TaxID=2125989 RepID=A0A8J6IWN9_9ALTE|nr:TonB-dependent receptor [Neptunicella marina]MBC3766773.1 TonB-dependent receptor [Neptunicella marina]